VPGDGREHGFILLLVIDEQIPAVYNAKVLNQESYLPQSTIYYGIFF
jgi:hypothetical protein